MLRTISVSEKMVFTDPPNLVTVSAAVAKTVLPDEHLLGGEVCVRRIQNVGGQVCFYSVGSNCDSKSYHGYLTANGAAGSCADLSYSRELVSVYSTSGTTIAVLVARRKDLDNVN